MENIATKYEYRLTYTLINGERKQVATLASCNQEALDNFYDNFCIYDTVADCYVCPLTNQPVCDASDPRIVDISTFTLGA